MRRLDDSTLEALAESICGSGEGTGGGYKSPLPYRTKSQIIDFFRRAGTRPQGQSSTRKWFALESLQALNGTSDLDAVLLRLASPKEYRGDAVVTSSVTDHLNHLLRIEGLELVLIGVEPRLRQRKASASVSQPRHASLDASPNFHRLVNDSSLADVLLSRWQEAQRCVRADAHLSAVVMMGSILEGVLLYKVETNLRLGNSAKSSPRDKRTGKPKSIQDWGLSALIDVGHEVGWLHGDVKRFSHALKDSRNLVHPYMERLRSERPDRDTCAICWQVVQAAVSDLLNID